MGLGIFGVFEDTHTVDIVHHQIGHDNIVGVLTEHLYAFGTRGRETTFQPNALEAFGHRAGVIFFVVHQQHPDGDW